MKTRNFFYLILFVAGCLFIANNNAFAQQPQQSQKKGQKAQTGQPSWMKSQECGENVKNIYFPAQDMYYNVKKKAYIYKKDGKKWEQSKEVPAKYSSVDLGKASKVGLTENTSKPQNKNSEHKKNAVQKNSKTGQGTKTGKAQPPVKK